MRTRHLSGAILMAAAALGLGCADRTPARFQHDAVPPAVTHTSYFSLHAVAVNQKGATLAAPGVSYASSAPDILEASPNGNLRCAKTGDATLTLTAGPLGEAIPLKCRIPTEIEVPREMQLVLGSAPVAARARALGEGRRPLDDVPVQLASSDEAVMKVEGDALRGVAVGRARLQASAGGIVGVTPVEVVETVISETLTLRDGQSRSFTLPPARYRVMIDVKVDPRIPQGVIAAWVGAACENQPEKPSHRFECAVAETATLTVTNPKTMGVGVTVSGPLRVFRVPPP